MRAKFPLIRTYSTWTLLPINDFAFPSGVAESFVFIKKSCPLDMGVKHLWPLVEPVCPQAKINTQCSDVVSLAGGIGLAEQQANRGGCVNLAVLGGESHGAK